MSAHESRSTTDENVTPDADAVLDAAFPPLGQAAAPTDPLSAASLELLAEARQADARRKAADDAVQRHIGPAAQELYRALHDAIDESRGAWIDVHVNEQARHFPGLAPALRLAWVHVIDCRLDAVGRCCADNQAVEV